MDVIGTNVGAAGIPNGWKFVKTQGGYLNSKDRTTITISQKYCSIQIVMASGSEYFQALLTAPIYAALADTFTIYFSNHYGSIHVEKIMHQLSFIFIQNFPTLSISPSSYQNLLIEMNPF